MIDYVIVCAITSAIKERPEHRVSDVVLFVTYLVLSVAAIVTAASMRGRGGDTSGVVLATCAPFVYFTLLPFGVLTTSA